MNRYLLTFITFLAVAGWLFFSYVPSALYFLPSISFPDLWSGRLSQSMAVVTLVTFLAVQGVIVYSTLRLSHRGRSAAQNEGMKLSLVAEFFWTILPLVMTLGLAVIGYGAWVNLATG